MVLKIHKVSQKQFFFATKKCYQEGGDNGGAFCANFLRFEFKISLVIKKWLQVLSTLNNYKSVVVD